MTHLPKANAVFDDCKEQGHEKAGGDHPEQLAATGFLHVNTQTIMARLTIKKYKNNNPQNKGYGKTYARLEPIETLTTDDLCRHIQKHGSIFTSDVVKGVTEKFVNCFNELLLEGYKIKLNGLGTFYLSISTEGEEDPEKFTAKNVKAVRIKFLGDKSKMSEYTTQMLTAHASFRGLDVDDQSSGSQDDPDGEDEPGGGNDGNDDGNDRP